MAHDPRARILRGLAGAVGRAVVDHDHFVPGRRATQGRDHAADAAALVEGGHDDGDGLGRSHR
jgi:hypothetical protein